MRGLLVAEKTWYQLYFANNLSLDSANTLRRRIADILERPDFGALTLVFSSDGGDTDQSIALFNYLVDLPIHLHMHAAGHVGSAALPVFVAGRERTSAPFARFFFHEYDWGFEKRQTLHQIDEAVKRLRSDIEMARNILKNRTKLPNKFLQAIEGRAAPAVIDPKEAQTFGLVDEICELRNISRDGMKAAVWTC